MTSKTTRPLDLLRLVGGVVLLVLGAMTMAGVKTTVITSNISSLLLIISLAHCVHLIVRFQEWRAAEVTTYAGYIIGFPVDTPEYLTRHMEIIKKELPVDIIEFTILTPLPGSEDHKNLHDQGVPMDADMNRYDLEHPTTDHPLMSRETLQNLYRQIWDLYY
ncbi:MAG: hypothetical protein IIA44_16175, partial [Acidobacteria bacterium]|nr:hypothetical protein [Acidobacteriota bacterium]